jgi:hypothetical protein
VLEVQTHFATCPACAARLDEARHLLAETERLVTALEPPAAAAAGAPRLMVGKPLIPLDPVVLIPDNPTPTEVRRNRFKIMAWAAGFLVVVGAGFFGLEMRSSLPGSRKVGNLRIRPEEFTFGTTKGQDSAAAVAASRPTPAPPPPQSNDAPQRPSPFGVAKPQAPAAQAQGAAGARVDSAPAPKPPANQPPPKRLADNTPAPQAKGPQANALGKTQPPPPKAPEKAQPQARQSLTPLRASSRRSRLKARRLSPRVLPISTARKIARPWSRVRRRQPRSSTASGCASVQPRPRLTWTGNVSRSRQRRTLSGEIRSRRLSALRRRSISRRGSRAASVWTRRRTSSAARSTPSTG